jgi:oxygen-independent coproporphyrinogen-3 oxidase
MADKYLLADEMLAQAGMDWYELSNWAVDDAAHCRHNQIYWTGGDWWGVGPGAHSHIDGVRWWNVKHPSAYASRLGAGVSPAQAREVLDVETRRVERVLLETRLRAGLPLNALDEEGAHAAAEAARDGLVDMGALSNGSVRLTRGGRLLADVVVRALLS